MAEPRLPLNGTVRITSAYGSRTDPITGAPNVPHWGLDMVNADRIICAASAGRVAVSQIVEDRSNLTWQWGNYVAILTDDGHVIYYCHMAQRLVTVGQRVEAGAQLGIMGATGYSTGVHLHFEVRTTGNQHVNAADYLGIANRVGVVQTAEEEPDATAQPADYSAAAVAWATANGIMLGDGNGDLMLDKPLTRRDGLVMLHRALGGKS